MGLVFTEISRGASGNRKRIAGIITFDNSYPTGGEVITPGLLGLIDIETLLTEDSGGETVTYSRATGKLQIWTADGVEAANASDQSAIAPRVLAFGT